MKSFNSKVLLFGEYVVLNGAKLIAVPYPKFNGALTFGNVGGSETVKESNATIQKLFRHVLKLENLNIKPNKELFAKDLRDGLFFDSNIPVGYGAGSSGALIAALYHNYFLPIESYSNGSIISRDELQSDLALIESFFHGKSSGTDPLVSYLNEPVVLNHTAKGVVKLPEELTFFLVDTMQEAKTEGLVNLFLEKNKNQTFKPHLEAFIEVNNQVVEGLLNTNKHLLNSIIKLSKLEQDLLPEMFIEHKLIQDFQDQYNNKLALKLCGSGGGGFLLGVALKEDFAHMEEYMQVHHIVYHSI